MKDDDSLGEAVGHGDPGARVVTEPVNENSVNGADRADGGLRRAAPQREDPLEVVYERGSAHQGRRHDL